jgi:hypothetical protein
MSPTPKPPIYKNSVLKLWLPYFVMSVALTTLVYTAVQQEYRQNANDPQVQIAEDAAAALDAGAAPSSLVPTQKVDQRSSLAPFLIITDANRNVLANSGQLDGDTVLPPAGSFEVAKRGIGKDSTINHENRITWQPNDQVRDAAVIVYHSGGPNPGYVIAARSLREVEVREGRLTDITGVTFAGLLVAGLILLLIIR